MDELYKQNAQIVYGFLYARCKDEALAEDLMQETFLIAMESLERFDGRCKISTWLCQIAKHLLYQHWAKVKHEIPGEPETEPTSPYNTEQQAIHRVELDSVWHKLQEMPELNRRVVLLRVMSDLSYREIGQLLGKSENWARVTFYRAKLILWKEVQDEENEL
ncbi:MAG: sigma-70 family RNA polymerase sigma factor [Lachnospiraceae bacterium]|nr:sigma-70 family RNA polymerase sigma factor [Lachnospiraceae bacterium]